MAKPVSLPDLKALHYAFGQLPETITIPATGERRGTVVKATIDATLDDLAFALLALDAEFDAASGRMHALRRLYGLARQAGALGVDVAARVVAADPPKALD